MPATKLVGLPVKVIPSTVYIDDARAAAVLAIPVPVTIAVFGAGKVVVVPSTWICPPYALVGIAIV